MQTQTPSAARRGIQLNKQDFRKAIEKAEAVRPRVVHIGAHYAVLQSDMRTFAQVTFTVYEGRLFATCTCFAHTRGHNDGGKPMPCYHIPAAALSRGAIQEIKVDDDEELDFAIKYEIADDFPTDEEIEEMSVQENRFLPAPTTVERRRDRYGVTLECHVKNGWDI